MHKIKINFMCGQYRFVDCDEMHVNGELMIFDLAGETQLTAVTRNISYFERMKPLPESRSLNRQDLFQQAGNHLTSGTEPGICRRRGRRYIL